MPLSPVENTTSRYIAEAVPGFPSVISDLVAQYSTTYDGVRLPLTAVFGEEERARHRDLIKDALISATCDPKIKRVIFELAQMSGYMEVIGSVLDQICRQGYRVNLDFVDLSRLNLDNLNLRGMTAVGAKFFGTSLVNTNLQYANLNSATFVSVCLHHADLSWSSLVNLYMHKTSLSHAKLCGADARWAIFSNVVTSKTQATGMLTDLDDLKALLKSATVHSASGGWYTVLNEVIFDDDYYAAQAQKYRFERSRKFLM